MPRIYIETYGCQMNVSDSELMLGVLGREGYVRADDPALADVVLVNTCAVRDHAEQNRTITPVFREAAAEKPLLRASGHYPWRSAFPRASRRLSAAVRYSALTLARGRSCWTVGELCTSRAPRGPPRYAQASEAHTKIRGTANAASSIRYL